MALGLVALVLILRRPSVGKVSETKSHPSGWLFFGAPGRAHSLGGVDETLQQDQVVSMNQLGAVDIAQQKLDFLGPMTGDAAGLGA